MYREKLIFLPSNCIKIRCKTQQLVQYAKIPSAVVGFAKTVILEDGISFPIQGHLISFSSTVHYLPSLNIFLKKCVCVVPLKWLLIFYWNFSENSIDQGPHLYTYQQKFLRPNLLYLRSYNYVCTMICHYPCPKDFQIIVQQEPLCIATQSKDDLW